MFHTTKSTNTNYFAFQSLKNNGTITNHSRNSDCCLDDVLPWLRIVIFGGNVTGMRMRLTLILMPAQKY